MIVSDIDFGCPVWGHRCGYDLANGKTCRRVVADRYVLCFAHSVVAGYVLGQRCAHVRGNGAPCKRQVRGDHHFCWQHPEDVAK
jgi:hypothetical protein